LQHNLVPFEFVIPQPRKWEAMFVRYNTRRYRWIAGVALGLVLLPMLGFFVRSEQEGHLEKQWAAMSGTVADLDALQTAIRRFRPWFDATPQNLQVLETLFAAFPEQGDVWAKTIQIKAGGTVICTGFARNRPAILALTDRLRTHPGVSAVQTQQIRGENPIQFTLTYKCAPDHQG
jgi:Tfp pilus assembly protein PilN